MNPSSPVITLKCTWKKTAGYVTEKLLLAEVPSSLDQVSQQIPEGAYTTFRTYGHTRALRLQDHFERLLESARRVNIDVQMDSDAIRQSIRDVLRDTPYPEARVRLTMDLTVSPGDVYIAAEELHTPPLQAYLSGVQVKTEVLHRENPKAKLTGFIEKAAEVRHHFQAGLNEILMIGEDGMILEGLSSNFFGIIDQEIWTAEEGILQGITRSQVLIAADDLGFPVRLAPVHISQLAKLQEAFITSASRGVLPVVQIDDQPVGSGVPGEMTRQLIDLFQIRIGQDIDDI